MFKYLVFANKAYYPDPGMEGCIVKTNSIDYVKKAILELKSSYNDFEFTEYIQFYDVINDELFEIDIDELKDNGKLVVERIKQTNIII